MRDPYAVLGLARTASEAEIKRAYRKLAKANHPDTHGDDPGASSRFAEISTAYEILGDKQKRGQFDRGEIDADGKPRFQGFEGFGGQGGFKGIDPRTFADAFGQSAGRGGARSFRFSTGPGGRFEQGGFGAADDILRSIFGGGQGAAGGARDAPDGKGGDVTTDVAVTLEEIAAGQKIAAKLPTGKTVAVALPKGVADGQTIRLKGQGLPAPSRGPSGDALVTVRFLPHALFRAEGSDLRLDVPVSLDEAVLGAKIAVPTLAGKVHISVPAGTSSGKILRLKAKGLPGKSKTGDLLVRLVIMLPDKADADLAELMNKWRRQDRKTPRGPEFG